MRIIELDASEWTTPLDFWDALAASIGAPHWHGRSPDAFVDSMIYGGINSVEPPYTIRVTRVDSIDPETKEYIELVAQVLKKARLWRFNHYHDDIDVTIEVAP